MPAIQLLSGLGKRAVYYTNNNRRRTSNPARYAAFVSFIGLFFILMILYACMSRRRLNRGYRPYYGTTWVLRKPGLAGKNTAQRAEKVSYGQAPEINDGSRPTNQDYAPPSSPPPAHTNHSNSYYGASDQNSGTYYPPPQNPPPSTSGANEYYPPPQGPPPSYNQTRN